MTDEDQTNVRLSLSNLAFTATNELSRTPVRNASLGEFLDTTVRRPCNPVGALHNKGALRKTNTSHVSGSGETGTECLLNIEEKRQIQRNQMPNQETEEHYEHLDLERFRHEARETTRVEISKFRNEILTEIRSAMTEFTRREATPAEINNRTPEREYVGFEQIRDEEVQRCNNLNRDRPIQGQNSGNIEVGSQETAMPAYHRVRTAGVTPVDKWGLAFDGDCKKMSVDDFLFRIEKLQAWNYTPWNEVIKEFHRLLKGRAKEWFWLYIKMNGVPTWEILKQDLAQQFSPRVSDFEIMRALMERVQGQYESIEDYLHQMTKLRSQLRRPITEEEMVQITKRNIKESVRRILYPMEIYSMEQLNAQYHGIEKAFLAKPSVRFLPSQNQPHRFSRQVSEVDDLLHDGDHAKRTRKPGREIICWNCNRTGHLYVECREAKTVFCFSCGNPGVIKPRCSRCIQGNGHRGTARNGESQHYHPGNVGNHIGVTQRR